MSYPTWRRPDPVPMPAPANSDTETNPDLSALLADWRTWQEASGLSERTITERAGVVKKLVAFTGSAPLELNAHDVVTFLARKGINNTSKQTYHSSLSVFFTYLLHAGLRANNPMLEVPKPRRKKAVPRPVEQTQLAATLAGIESRRSHQRRTRMMVLLAAYAGLRVHEIAKIKGEDIDHSAGLVYVCGKGLKEAAIPLHSTILEAATEFPAVGYWFPSYAVEGEPVTPHAVSKTLKNAMAGAGVTASPHQLRHLFGTALVRNGVDLRTVQELMRHENLGTTAIYTQVSDESRRTAIAGLAYSSPT